MNLHSNILRLKENEAFFLVYTMQNVVQKVSFRMLKDANASAAEHDILEYSFFCENSALYIVHSSVLIDGHIL